MIFNEELTPKTFAKFLIPSILIMLCISIYTVIDGVFVAQFVNSDALASINIILPLFSIAFAVGIMFATGGGALVSMKLGEQKTEDASKYFSQLFIVGVSLGLVATILCLAFQPQLLSLLGTPDVLFQYAKDYSFYMIISYPLLIAKVLLETFLRADGHPNKALVMSITGGVTNIILDFVFIVLMDMGIAGAGLGTFLGNFISIFIGLRHFTSGKSNLKFVATPLDYKFFLSTITNGSSEMVNEIAIAFTTFILNGLTLKYAGTNGVAAISVILYINFIFTSINIGFAMGVAPLISYQYGAKNDKELKKIMTYCKRFLLISSPLLLILTLIGSPLLVTIFVKEGAGVYDIAIYGLRIFAFSFLFTGLNMFGSGLFTALGNGKISAFVSFSKTFIFFTAGAFILPGLLDLTGVWLIMPCAELLSGIIVLYLMGSPKMAQYEIV